MVNDLPFKIWNNGKRISRIDDKFCHVIRFHNQGLVQLQSVINFCSDIPNYQSIDNYFPG